MQFRTHSGPRGGHMRNVPDVGKKYTFCQHYLSQLVSQFLDFNVWSTAKGHIRTNYSQNYIFYTSSIHKSLNHKFVYFTVIT